VIKAPAAEAPAAEVPLVDNANKAPAAEAPAAEMPLVGDASAPDGAEEDVRRRLGSAKQGHVFGEWDNLSHAERGELLADLQARPLCLGGGTHDGLHHHHAQHVLLPLPVLLPELEYKML